MSRTGIHGGLRRGTAAAAIGAVLVLSTGVQASLADDAVPPQDPAAQASQAGTAKDGSTATPRGKAPAVPGALLPAVEASLSAGSTTAMAQATAQDSMTGLPLPDVPLPSFSGTPLVPGGSTTSPEAPAGGASSTATRPGSSTQPVPTKATAPGVAPAAGTSAAAGAPAPTPPALGTGTGDQAVGAKDAVQAAGGAAGTAGTSAGGESGGDAAGQAAGGAAVAPSPALPTSLPTGLSINARQSQPTRAPQAAAAPAGPGSAVSSTGPLPDMPDAMVWLGAGLVGVGAAAGLVFLRMRRP